MTSIKLSDLPSPENEKKGWPWTEDSSGYHNNPDEILEWPKISIITPSFNQGKFIEETIRSILLQNYPNLEYIVVDGGSTDETLKILHNYENYITWLSEPDDGQTDAINKGIKMASGEIIAYLNSDDIYEPGTLITVMRVFLSHPDAAMVFGDTYFIDKDSRIFELHEPGEITRENCLIKVFSLVQPSVFFRMCVTNHLGYFDENLHLAMDYDYFTKILLTYKGLYIHHPLSRARIYPDAKSTATEYKFLDERLYILNNLFEKYPIEKFRKKVYGFVYFHGALVYLKNGLYSDAVRNTIKALKYDCHYLVNPRLYWGISEVFLGENISKKIKPSLKKIMNPRNMSKFESHICK